MLKISVKTSVSSTAQSLSTHPGMLSGPGALCALILLKDLLTLSGKHSLYYIYTALSKPVDLPGVYQFTAMGLLDDTQIDYYNSEEQKKIPKQTWMKEKLYEDYWEKGTQSRKSKEQWFYKNIDILMKRMRHSESDLHVFQMRTGCEVEQWGSEFKFSKFNSTNQEKMGQYADPKPIHQRIPGERVSLLEIGLFNELILVFLDPPECHMFAKRSIRDKSIVKLSCMVTAFYPKDTALFIRKSRTSLPEDETESTGIRPNHDGTFQIKKSVEIKEDEKAEYGCFVTHRTLKNAGVFKKQKEHIISISNLFYAQLYYYDFFIFSPGSNDPKLVRH
uniref:Ig-like domain-containing protein n=1 Tax=Cyprinus carpio TaxID=7962 RepID=A0A8C1X1D9_CYPCA